MDEAKTILAIRKQLGRKFGLQLPPDTDPKTFLRDLLAATHGHPGVFEQGAEDDYDDEDDAGDFGEADDSDEDEDEDDDDEDLADDQEPARMGHRRRMSAARGKQCAEEVLRNIARPTPGRSAMATQAAKLARRLSHARPTRKSAEERERDSMLAELRRNVPGILN